MKYNYVVFGTEDQYYTYGYSDLNNNRDDTIYIEKPAYYSSLGTIIDLLRRVHLSEKINKITNLPCKEIWNSLLFQYKFNNEKPICFVFFSSSKFSDSIPFGFVEHLKKNFPGSKYVVFYQDLVRFKRKVSLNMYREKMDLLISFDYKDAKDNGMLYHPLVYSDIAESVGKSMDSDIYFCGAAKNRLKEVLEVFYYLRELGLKCDFHIIVDNPEKYSNEDGLEYSTLFPYYENLEHAKSSKVLLEIMQKGGTGLTIRTCEAIALNKKLITNNPFITHAAFYNTNDFSYFKNIGQIDKDFITNTEKATSHQYMEQIGPYRFMEFIDECLEKQTR